MTPLKDLINILNSKYKHWESLKEIYDQVKEIYGSVYTPWIFWEFVKTNKKNKNFMQEFEKTSFI